MEIQFNQIRFAYNKEEVLHGVSGQFKAGEFHALLGPNGCGKSTLLKCLNHLLQPQQGEVRLNNRPVQKFSKRDLARIIGYVPQSTNSLYPQDVYHTVMLGRKPHVEWIPGEKDQQMVLKIIQELQLDGFILRNLNDLSGGEQQRVHIARALAQQPSVLLLDEPTSNLDLKYQVEVMEVLKKVSDQNITVIVVIHDVNLALRYATNFILMKKGHILEQGTSEIINEQNLEKLYDTHIKKIVSDDKVFFVPG